MKTATRDLLAGMLLAGAAGCSTVATRVDDLVSYEEAILTGFPTAESMQPTYTLSPGDVLDISFVSHPEFDQEVLVRPDGLFSLPLAEEVRASGRTLSELDMVLTDLVSTQLKDPELTIILKQTASQAVFVGGEVQKPGRREMPDGRMTLTEAVLMSGGYRRDTANIEEVILIRPGSAGARNVCRVNLEQQLVSPALSSLVFLAPRDVIIIPPKGVIDVNDWIERYINRNLPGRGWFGVSLVPGN